MIVTRQPSAENTCANSAATKPPPTITRCSGTSAIRMMVSLVWNVDPARRRSPAESIAREPAAITT